MNAWGILMLSSGALMLAATFAMVPVALFASRPVEDRWFRILGRVTGLGAVLMLAFLIPACITMTNDANDRCADKGGHIVGGGRSEFCVSSDGRILE